MPAALDSLIVSAVTDSVTAAVREEIGGGDWLGGFGSVASLIGLGVSLLTLYLVRDLQGRHAMRVRLPDLARRLTDNIDVYDQSVLDWINSRSAEDLEAVLDRLALVRQLVADISQRSQDQVERQANELLVRVDRAKTANEAPLFQEVRRESRMLVLATENYIKDQEARL